MVVAEAPAVDEPAVGPARAGPERERTGAYVCTLVVEEFIPDADGPACEGDIKGAGLLVCTCRPRVKLMTQ